MWIIHENSEDAPGIQLLGILHGVADILHFRKTVDVPVDVPVCVPVLPARTD